jgi:hypothetical protein
MKGKVTSLVLVGAAFIIGILTQDSSPNTIVGSRVLTAFITIAWFGVMGAGLYFWAKHSRQKTSQRNSAAARVDGNTSLRQLAQAVGPNKTVSMTENAASTEETTPQEAKQKTSS